MKLSWAAFTLLSFLFSVSLPYPASSQAPATAVVQVPDAERTRTLGLQEYLELLDKKRAEEHRNNPSYKKLQSPILQIGSTYLNEGPPSAKITEVGTGTLVNSRPDRSVINGENLVLSAAHLVQGESPWVKVNGKRVPAEVVAVDALYDVALLKIPPVGIEPAYDLLSDDIYPRESLSWRLQCLAGRNPPQADLSSSPRLQACPDQIAVEERLTEVRFLAPFQPGGLPRGVVYSPSWAASGSETAPSVQRLIDEMDANKPSAERNIYPWNYDTPIGRGFEPQTFVIPSLITPGNSGGLAVDAASRFKFLGLPVQFNLFLQESTLVGPGAVLSLYQKYLRRAPVEQTRARYKMKNGYFYIDFGDGMVEADFVSQPAGQGFTAPPGGNGVTAPPGGNGVTAPPGGNGVTAPPGGNGVTAPPGGNGVTAPPGGNGVTAPPGDDCDRGVDAGPQSKSLQQLRQPVQSILDFIYSRGGTPVDPREVLKKFGITPNFSQGGKAVYGFEVRDRMKGGITILAPTLESYRWIQKQNGRTDARYTAIPLYERPDLGDIIAQRFDPRQYNESKRAFNVEKVSPPSINIRSQLILRHNATPEQIWAEARLRNAPSDREPEVQRDRVTISVERNYKATSAIRIRWEILKPKRGSVLPAPQGTDPYRCPEPISSFELDDEIIVTMDGQGRIQGRSDFEPEILVTSKKGKQYYLDLRSAGPINFMVSNPSTAQRDWAQEAAEAPFHDSTGTQALEAYSSQLALRLREVRPKSLTGTPNLADTVEGDRTIEFPKEPHLGSACVDFRP